MTAGVGGIPTRVLVLGMAHQDGTIVADELYPVAEACGQTAEQVRSCLRRLVAEGLFARDGRAARPLPRHRRRARRSRRPPRAPSARLRPGLTPATAGTAVAPRRLRHPRARAPPATRSTTTCCELGGAAVHNGLYVSPHRWEKDVGDEADRLGVVDTVTRHRRMT